jgi:hypothetical protein
MFNVAVAAAVLPALSVAVPPKTWFEPVVVTLMGLGQTAIPDKVSEHVKVIVTGIVVLIPFAFGAGEIVAVIEGGVLSRLTVAQAGAELFPAVSTACPQMDWFAPSAETLTGGAQLRSGYVPATQVKVTVTFDLFQPLLFGAGDADAVIDGGMKGATVKVTVAAAGDPCAPAAVTVACPV